jgi:hypothetical protein
MEIILFLLAAVIVILSVFAGLSARSPLFVCVAVTAMVTWHVFRHCGIGCTALSIPETLVYLVGHTVPLVAFLGGWVMLFPAIVIFATLRRRLADIGYLRMWGIAGFVFLFFWSIEGLGRPIWSLVV